MSDYIPVVLDVIYKHLAGQHDQETHGRRGNIRGVSEQNNGSADLGVQGSGAIDYSDTSRDSLINNENYYNAKTERAYVYNENGEVIFSKSGNEKSIKFTNQELGQFKNSTFLHNHPNGSSFSEDDIRCAEYAKMKEIQCTSVTGTYVMTRPPRGWKKYAAYDSDIGQKVKQWARLETLRYGDVSGADMLNKHWEIYAGLTGAKYAFIPRG